MANVRVSLYQSLKLAGKWTLRRVPEQWLKRLSEGGYYVRFGNHMQPAGRGPGVALATLSRKQAELKFVAVGGKVECSNREGDDLQRTKVMAAVKEYLADCRDRQGKSGCGFAPRIVEA